jgi:membrane-associated protease RseP (regulator of RpoE activity)
MPSGERDEHASPVEVAPSFTWRTNAWLLVATIASTFITWVDAERHYPDGVAHPLSRAAVLHGVQFTVALMAILLAHEFGHYIAARIHKVDASLPYFIPMPLISPFGTMGAVIRMRSVIPTRRALLDIGGAGPLAGLAIAIPLYAWGIGHSSLVVVDAGGPGGFELGSSLLTRALDALFGPAVPEGMDIQASPMLFAGWAGMFVTMINLLPAGQLDGGHVAFALLGPRQNTVARWVHRSMLAFFFVNVISFVLRDLRAGVGMWHFGRHVNSSIFWFVWFEALAVLGTLSTAARSPPEDGVARLSNRTRIFATVSLALLAGALHDKASPFLWTAWFLGLGVLLAMEIRWGALRAPSALLDHPPTSAQPLSFGRAAIAILTLALFALLFMPTPIAM